jgi:DNA-binding NtrC family response regulator
MSKNATNGQRASGGGRPVLIVDDEPAILTLLRTALESAGYAVRSARDGMEAFELLKAEPFACMVLDVQMPRISGVELLLLMHTENLRVPTIVMARFSDFKEGEMKQFANVVKFMPKPLDPDSVVQAVREHESR